MRRILLLIPFLLLIAAVAAPASFAEEGDQPVKKSAHTKKASAKKPKGKKAAAAKKKGAVKAEEKPKAASTALVKEVRSWTNPDYTRISISLDHEAAYESHQIKKSPSDPFPSRIYLDINGAKAAPGLKDVPVKDGFLKTVRVGQFKGDVVRVVLDVEKIRDFKVFTFSDPFQIIIDVKGERTPEFRKAEPVIQQLSPAVEARASELKEVAEPAPAREKPQPLPPPKPGKVRRIVVDPGHGGHDPGASGANGVHEKDVVLAMGLKLAERLRKDLGLDVVMTRSTDVFIPLEERTAIANKVNADLFVSIHANASLNRSASGIETYYLNLAKTEKSAQLAARENNTSLEKVSVLQAVLYDLMANYKLNDSAHLAEEVQKGVVKRVSSQYTGVRNNGVKQGPFYVLVGATMPSILVETAFVTNEKEEARLRDPAYQDSTVQGIEDGIRAYISGLK